MCMGVGKLIYEDMYHDYKFHGANMGPTWGRQDPGGPHVGPMNFAICAQTQKGWQTSILW